MKRLIIVGSLLLVTTACGGDERPEAADRRACALLQDALTTRDEDSPRSERLREAASTGIDAEREEIRVAARVLDTALEANDEEGVTQGTEEMEKACENLK